jgi:phospholipid transport system substrate-binding protein
MMRARLALILVSASLAFAPASRAAAADPAIQPIEALDAALVGSMKAAKTEPAQRRYRDLEPAVTRSYDFPTMVRFAVGPGWTSFTPAQKQALTEAFERLTVASYVHELSGWSGQRFDVDPDVVTRGPDKVVTTHLISPGEAPVAIAYRMRESGGAWKIIDVFFNGSISQLTTRRADFASTVASGGAPALLAHLSALADKAMR